MDVLVYDPNSSNTLVGLLKGQGLSFEIYMDREAFSKKVVSSRDSSLLIFLGEGTFDDDLRWLSSLEIRDRRAVVVVPSGHKGMISREYTVYERPVSMEVLANSLGHTSGDGNSRAGYEALLSVLFNLEQNMFTGSLAVHLFSHEARYVYKNGRMVDFLWDGESRPELALLPMGAHVHGWTEEPGAVPEQVAGYEQMEPLHDQLDSWLELTGQLPKMDAVLDIDERVLVEHLEDIPDMANPVLRLLDGGSSMLDVILSSQYDPLTTARYLAYLYFAGVIYESEDLSASPSEGGEKQFSEWLRDPVKAVQKIRRTNNRKRDTDVGMKLPQPRGKVVDELHMQSPVPDSPQDAPRDEDGDTSQDIPDESEPVRKPSSEPISSDGSDSSTVVGEISLESPNEGVNDNLPKADFDIYDAETIPPNLLSVPKELSDSDQRETLLGLGKLQVPELDDADTMVLPALEQEGHTESTAEGSDSDDTSDVRNQEDADFAAEASESTEIHPLEHRDTLIIAQEKADDGEKDGQEDKDDYEPTPIPSPKPFVGRDGDRDNAQLNLETLQYHRRSHSALLWIVLLGVVILVVGAYRLFSGNDEDGIMHKGMAAPTSAAEKGTSDVHGTPTSMKKAPPKQKRERVPDSQKLRLTAGTHEDGSDSGTSGASEIAAASSSKPSSEPKGKQVDMAPQPRPQSQADALKREENRALVDQFMRQKSWKFLRMLEKRHAECPDDLYLKGALAYAYAYKGNSSKAASLAAETLKADSKNYLAWYALASIALERGQNAKMREYFFRFLQNAPQDMVGRKWMDTQTYKYIKTQVKIYKKQHNIK